MLGEQCRISHGILMKSFSHTWRTLNSPNISGYLACFGNPLGVFVKNELIPIRLVAETMAGMTRVWWEKYIPIIEDGREKTGIRRWYSETEYLYNELMKYMEEYPELAT